MYQMKLLTHKWLPTDRPTDQQSDQLLELLEWLFATNKTEIIVTVWSGGFALLATSGVVAQVIGGGVGAAGLAPLLGGLGLAGAAGAGLMAMSECSAPLCIADNGQCCLLTMNTRGIVCPPSC